MAACNPLFGAEPECDPNCGGSPCYSVGCRGFTPSCDPTAIVECWGGPDQLPTPQLPARPLDCVSVFDADEDGDVDLVDFATYVNAYAGR